MNIIMTGRHVDITKAMREIVGKKLSKIEKRFDRLGDVNVTLKAAKNHQYLEVNTVYLGNSISVSASDKDYYCAVDQVVSKLKSSLASRKGQIDTIGRDKPPMIEDESEQS